MFKLLLNCIKNGVQYEYDELRHLSKTSILCNIVRKRKLKLGWLL